MDALLAPLDLTTRQWLLLAVLSRADRPLSLSEAAARYGSSRQNIKQIAVGLQRRGYLRLAPDPLDARTLRLHPTDAIARFDEPAAAAQGAAFLADVFRLHTADEVITLHRLVRRWLTAAAEEAGTGSPTAVDPNSPIPDDRGTPR
jgi:DNA-binding MarR family transcriptional regulator